MEIKFHSELKVSSDLVIFSGLFSTIYMSFPSRSLMTDSATKVT